MNEGRQRADIVGEFFAGVAEGLDFSLGRRVPGLRDGQTSDLAVHIAQRDSGLVGP